MYNLINDLINVLPSRLKRPIKLSLLPYLPKPDYYLISYPKSGRTWLRMMLGTAIIDHLNLQYEDPTDLGMLSRLTNKAPTIEVSHDSGNFDLRSSKFFWQRMYSSSRILFLARDPRDVLVSFYHHLRSRRVFNPSLPSFDSPREMIKAEAAGLRSIIDFYNMWAENLPRAREHHLTFYEDLQTDPVREVERCLQFLGYAEMFPDSILKAVEHGQFNRMQDIERSGNFTHHRLKPGDGDNPESFKVRKGMVGGYVNELSEGEIREMDILLCSELSQTFSRYKYKTRSDSAGRSQASTKHLSG